MTIWGGNVIMLSEVANILGELRFILRDVRVIVGQMGKIRHILREIRISLGGVGQFQ